ncbi:MAG: hypothetical protein ACRD0W_05980, partial [Acidimicrobiales bacterium]
MPGTSARIGEVLAIRRCDVDMTTTPATLGHTDPKLTVEHYIRRNEHVNPLTAELLDGAFGLEAQDAGSESWRPLTIPITSRYLSVMRSNGPALLPVFRSQHQAELLMWLMLHPDKEFSVSDLAARLDVPISTLHREVVRLDHAGLIASRTLGRNRMLRANVDHPAARPLTLLLEVTFGPKAVVAEEFALHGVEQVLIFGSWAARYAGEAGPPPHDIDVLVIGRVDRADLYDAADRS